MIGDAPHSHTTGVPGWETPAEQELLVELARAVPQDGLIIEIGAEYGMSASLFCYAAKSNVEIISFDLFPGDLINTHEANLSEAGYYGVSERIQSDSAEAGRNWSTDDIDLLFIDGDHSYKGCKADIDAWVKHIKPGGRVAFHDTACATNPNPHPLHHEVSRAINDWLAEDGDNWQFLESVDSIMVFERVK